MMGKFARNITTGYCAWRVNENMFVEVFIFVVQFLFSVYSDFWVDGFLRPELCLVAIDLVLK